MMDDYTRDALLSEFKRMEINGRGWHERAMTAETQLAAALARAEAAEKRIAELDARLAEQEWRPVTEKPTEAGYYQTVNDGLYEHCYYGPNGWEDYYLPPTHWRPLTDPPLIGES